MLLELIIIDDRSGKCLMELQVYRDVFLAAFEFRQNIAQIFDFFLEILVSMNLIIPFAYL